MGIITDDMTQWTADLKTWGQQTSESWTKWQKVDLKKKK